MSSPSNLYAEKIFSEHPLALWPLDEKLDYASLISEQQRDISDDQSWSLTNGVAEETSFPGPISGSITTRILADEPEEEAGYVIATGPELIESEVLSEKLGSFAISAYIYSETSFVDSVEIGYQVGDAAPIFKAISFQLLQTWRQVSSTFEVPISSGKIRPLIKINYRSSGQPEQEYGFFINGISIGQWAEQFSVSSLGVLPEELPDTIALPASSLGLKIDSYGQQTPGYYLGSQTSFSARNFGVPIVFGSEAVTSIVHNDELPSIIVPGFGFFNRAGQFRNLTLEFWVKINNSTKESFPIVKALNSSDGLYADGPFLTLKVNEISRSHFVGEWGRPMLIDIIITNNFVSLLLNSEQVISFPISIDDIVFPAPLDKNGKDQDWLAFYASKESEPIQIDCIAIYPYQVPEVMAKRRLVYAQGVELPDNGDSSYIASSVDINYPFANYANNYNYPDLGRWENGVSNNISINRDVMSLPEYELPSVFFDSNKNTKMWVEDLSSSQLWTEEPWYSLRPPKPGWQDVNGYILFNNLENTIEQPLSGFYGIFDKRASQSGVLIRVKDRLSQNFFEITSENDSIVYRLSYNNVSTVFVSDESIRSYEKFICGIEISKFSRFFGNNLAAFFGNIKNLQLYLGGREDFSGTFGGRIHSFHLASLDNLSSIKDFIQDSGVMLENGEFFPYREGVQSIPTIVGGFPEDIFYDQLNGGDPDSEAEDLLDGGAPDTWILEPPAVSALNSAYTLRLLENKLSEFGYELAISSCASWQDYVPLSLLSKNVKNASNEDYYSLDFIQINFDYPRVDRVVGGYLNTSSEFLRTYVTFQPLDFGAHRNIKEYLYSVPPSQNGVVEPGKYVVGMDGEMPVIDSFTNTKYEVVNGMIVYPPANIDVNKIAIVIHFEVDVPNIQRYPIKIKELQLASLSLNDIAENPVSTQRGVPIFPYTKLNVYFDYKLRNPFEIYKGNTPYLYLTKNSGVRLRGDSRVGISRGISMPINQGQASTYSVGAMQFAFRYDEPSFPTRAIEVFELEAANDYIKFYLVATDNTGKRGRIYGVNTRTGGLQPGLVFYLNGILQRELIIDSGQWLILGLQFLDSLNFAGVVGAFRTTGPLLINNVYHYQYASFEERETVRTRSWLAVLNTLSGTAVWEDYAELSWLDVLYILTTEKPAIDPRRIYKTYTGTNRIVVGDDIAMSLRDYKYKVYANVVWDSRVIDPV
jgi:hypothetical protein